MKKTFILCSIITLVFIMHSCMTSYQVVTTDKAEKIIEVPNTAKNTLYVKANQWMVESFASAKSVIQFQDKEAGIITGKYLLNSSLRNTQYGTVGGESFAIINIRVKDNTTKITITPQGTWQYDSSGLTIYNYSPSQAAKDINDLILSYEEKITSKNETW